MIRQKLRTAARLLRNGDAVGLLDALIRNYESGIHRPDSAVSVATAVPLVVLHELHLVLDEGAVAYPRPDSTWTVHRCCVAGTGGDSRRSPAGSREPGTAPPGTFG